jgi:hypothetical protein
MLTPAPKVYEVYVLIKTAEALQRKHGGRVAACWRTIHCYLARTARRGPIRIYYNRPPPSFSRLVYTMAGSRPHPDILLAYGSEGETRVVVDAKYRLAFSLTARSPGSRLELAEALRLLGYVADLARNASLRAILAVPEKAEAEDRLTRLLDGLAIDVQAAEVSPRTGAGELIRALP